MAELVLNTVLQEVTNILKNEPFSAMYFGRHLEKNLLILKHDITVMVVLEDLNQWSNPRMIKTVSFRGDAVKGVQLVGNEDVILLLDEFGSLWRLINAFESPAEKQETLYLLEDSCFYEWVLFKEAKLAKVLALSRLGQGFAFLGLTNKNEKKMFVLPSSNSGLEDYTFEELSVSHSFDYYLLNLNIDLKQSVFSNKIRTDGEILLVSDRFTGKTYLSAKNGENCLVNQSNISLTSVLHFERQKCLAFCFKNGKLIFTFYSEPKTEFVVFLHKKVVAIERCCCSHACLLWSDGTLLQHTKVDLERSEDGVRLSHLKLKRAIENLLWLLCTSQSVLTVTVNNIYYSITPGSSLASEIQKHPKELFQEMNEASNAIEKLELETDMLSYYLYCRDVLQKKNIRDIMEMKWEENRLVIKSRMTVHLRREFWKIRLKALGFRKQEVRVVDLEHDVSEGMIIKIENPFQRKSRVGVSLVGEFHEKMLFFHLGEVGECKDDVEQNQLSKNLKIILKRTNPLFIKNKNSLK